MLPSFLGPAWLVVVVLTGPLLVSVLQTAGISTAAAVLYLVLALALSSVLSNGLTTDIKQPQKINFSDLSFVDLLV